MSSAASAANNPRSLRALCEKLVKEIRVLENKYFDWRDTRDWTMMLPNQLLGAEERRGGESYGKEVANIETRARETRIKWSLRLNAYHQAWRCEEWTRKQIESFDEHGTLFNLALRSIVFNLRGPLSGDFFCVEQPFYHFIRLSKIPRVIRDELMEWHGLNIMAKHFHRYRMLCCGKPYSPLTQVLAIWSFRCNRYHGLSYEVHEVISLVYGG